MAASRDPEAIAREIEQTRAELADMIDAIAGRINPRRAASKGAAAMRSQLPGNTARQASDSDGISVVDVTGAEPTDRGAGVDPKLLAAGAAAGAALGLLAVRRKR